MSIEELTVLCGLLFAQCVRVSCRLNCAGQFERLVDAKSLVNNKPLGFISDLSVASDGTIFFTSASSKWNHAKRLNILLEGEKTGR